MNFSSRYFFIVFLCAVLAGTGFFIILLQKSDKPTEISTQIIASEAEDSFLSRFGSAETYEPAQILPEIEIIGFNEKTIMLADFKGKWRLVNFWAAWCPPCIEEMPGLIQLEKERGGKNFEVVVISVDSHSGEQHIRDWMKKAGLLGAFHEFYVKNLDVWYKLGLEGVPTSLIIGPDGRLYYKLVGERDWSDQETLDFIDKLLKN
ncbi:MAG: hypothetical protein CO093_09590 [Alphaproteobacteria bacterium CG_4_9_14_3_um_filter_47_13]|nr:MAG: hypothetical protein CO093_09590 [Alphaproteobacteria bacterium CG_4_9_14_3_um_filter_47_13]